MAIDPLKRFQTAEEMRHALEQLNICMNWHEKTLSDGTRWVSGWDKKCYEVVRIRASNNKWSITTRKGSSRKKLRRTTALCYNDLTKAKALQITKRVLQDYVLGKVY